MASRRDELNAYTFARKRMVGAFLQPSGGGNDEDAPRPVRAVLPSVVVAAVIVAGFGMLGVIKPAAPQGWDDGKNIIQGKDSTTRYVVLVDPTTKEKVLHQVLNMSSARLVLPAGAKVTVVADAVLDAYKNHGATIGIPYAPDRLPDPADAGVAKTWSVCDRPGKDKSQATINQAVFVTAGKEAKALANPSLVLGGGQWLFVEAPPLSGNRASDYLVDSNGFKHALGQATTSADVRSSLESGLFGADAQPQQVTQEWLNTLQDGNMITFPTIPGFKDTDRVASNVPISQPDEQFVGRLLSYQGKSFYVMGQDSLYEVTAFQAELIRQNPALKVIYKSQTPKFAELSPSDYAALRPKIDQNTLLKADSNAPKEKPSGSAVNADSGAKARTVLCSTFQSMDDSGNIKQTVWADANYPTPVNTGSSSAHVSPGAGLLFRSVDAGAGGSGSNFLITETGLRYSVQSNSDGTKTSTPSPAPQSGQSQVDEAQARLGYDKIQPVPVPGAWANLVPGGPVLNTAAALQAQNA
ncbi:type VII secretion protein EccB [Kitasatospora sp. MAP5-34]|uniref:type VII secretion protein EccB n=1 Tax=Kitasatospora sp. MAP5-34 TaxID=3035102 RepID=UPI00247707BA|nr:type VII secretion protein EccB [Kitasatospora sp. MAP5-34]MDH6579651.1 type VII secretion protein EccB [Kitasatospora sp. MAP5-34]